MAMMESDPSTPKKSGGGCPVRHHQMHHMEGDVPAPEPPMISNIESFVVSTVPLVPELAEVRTLTRTYTRTHAHTHTHTPLHQHTPHRTANVNNQTRAWKKTKSI